MLRATIFCLLPFALSAQDASLTLAGSVVNAQNGEPLKGALVSIQRFPILGNVSSGSIPQQQVSRTALTDAGGAFRFSDLPTANYLVRAQKPGFGTSLVNGTQSSTVELKSTVDDVRLKLSALGVISGKVVDENGEPMRGVGISAFSSRVSDGVRQYFSQRTVRTDDRGAYRMSDLMPGKYFLKATGQGGGNLVLAGEAVRRLDPGDSFSPVYSGGGQAISTANPVEISAGTQAGADFRLKLEAAWQVRGTLRNFTPGQNVTFALVIAGEEIGVRPDLFNGNSGAFEIREIVSGAYVLRASQEDKTGEVAVNVNGADADNVALALYPSVDIPVSVRFTDSPAALPKRAVPDDSDDDDPSDAGCYISLTAERLNGSAGPPAVISMMDDFLRKVPSGNHRISIQCSGAYIRSALAGTQDLLANPFLTIKPGSSPQPIAILATHGGGMISAKIDSSLPVSAPLVRLLLVPQFSGSTGPFSPPGRVLVFGNLAPGTYAIYAFANLDIEFRNPEFLKSLSGGQTVQIEGDEKKEITIDKVIP